MTNAGGAASKDWLLRIGWLLAALGAPAVIGGAGRQLVAKHPVSAALLLLGYWIVLATVKFAGAVGNDLAQRWRDRLVERIDRASVRRLSGFGKRYAEYVLGSLRFIDQKGLPTVGFYTPELDEVFVDVSLARRSPHEASADPLADLPADVTERLSISDFLDRNEPVVLAVTGAPGSGKTTLLRHTARHICRSPRGRRRHVPMLLYLRDHVNAIVEGRDDGLPSLLRSTLGAYGPEPAGWFEQCLRGGQCVVLLDGLDEVAQDENRRVVSAWVERQITQYPKNDYVITSRPHGYRSAPIEAATVVHTRRFTEEQATRFVRSWYLAVERRSTGEEGEDVQLLASSGADDLLERLKRAPALYELTANPLLLTMIANVHRFRGALPGSRADLYRDICEVMLWRRHEAKKLTAELAGEHKEALLRGLAFTMMQRKVRDLSISDILDAVRPGLIRVSRAVSAEAFLDDVGSSGLLVERENGVYSFAHHTFQEYLAAAHIREKDLVGGLAKNVDDTWWRETTLLYVVRANADPIVNACLDSSGVAALALAFDCAEQKTELAPALRRRLDELLALAENVDADPERRRLMTGILITRHLRRVIPLANGGYLCVHPITKGIYRLFLHDMKVRGQNRAPDSSSFTGSSDKDVVTGVRGEDAVVFVNWVNDLIGDPIYRLPTREETNDLAVRSALTPMARSLWLQPQDNRFERWAASGTDSPHVIESSAIVQFLTRDIEESGHLIPRLLLVRAVVAVSLINRALDRALNYARGADRGQTHRSQDLGIIHVLDVVRARDLSRALARVRDHVPDLVRSRDQGLDLDRDLGLAPVVDQAIDRALDQAFVLDLRADYDLDLAADLVRARALADDLARDLKLALDCAKLRDLDIVEDLDNALERARVLATGLGSGQSGKAIDTVAPLAMGPALGSALSDTVREFVGRNARRPLSQVAAEFVQQLARRSNTESGACAISLETLTERARDQHLFDPSLIQSSTQMCHIMAAYLEKAITPILNREVDINRESAAVIRFCSICLAAEATTQGGDLSTGDQFREIAAGITFLEERILGNRPPDEMLILALE